MTINKFRRQSPRIVIDDVQAGNKEQDGFLQPSGIDLKTGEIPKDKVIRHAILNNLRQSQSMLCTEDWDLFAQLEDELGANGDDDDGIFHLTGIDLQTDEIPKDKPTGEAILSNLQQVQSSLSTEDRGLVTPPQDGLRAHDGRSHRTGIDLHMTGILKGKVEVILSELTSIGEIISNQLQPAQSIFSKKYRDLVIPPQDDHRAKDDDYRLFHLIGADLQVGEILKGKIEAILNSLQPIGEAILNLLQPAQSILSTEDRDLVTPPEDNLQANDDDDGLLHLTGADLQTGEILKDKTIGEAVLNNLQQVQSILPPEGWDLVTEFADKLRANDEIALMIGTLPLLYRLPSGKLSLSKTGFRLGMNLHVDLFDFLTFMDGEWLSSTAIDGVLAELARVSPGVQLMSSQKAYEHICKLRQDMAVESSDIIRLHPDTHTLIFPFNLSESHWAVAKAACHEDGCFLTVYNSDPNTDARLIRTELPAVMNCILDANSANPHWSSWRDTATRVQGQSLRQQDGHNCGIYAIFNTLALVQLQEPFLHFGSFDPRALRMDYVQALARAI
ncbi:hypothetical protein MMC29_003230 [Sticta canariensis]|nr:hypothetical protein [Sticta canariensis]